MTSGHEVARALRAAYLALHRRTNDCLAQDGVTAWDSHSIYYVHVVKPNTTLVRDGARVK